MQHCRSFVDMQGLLQKFLSELANPIDRRTGDNSVELEPQLYAQPSSYAEDGEDDTDDEDDARMAMEDEEGEYAIGEPSEQMHADPAGPLACPSIPGACNRNPRNKQAQARMSIEK
jgi:hypothetical protein